MLYMVGKIILYGISFNIVYTESRHKNIKKSKTLFFQEVQGKKSIFLKQRWRDMKQHSVMTNSLHIISKVTPYSKIL